MYLTVGGVDRLVVGGGVQQPLTPLMAVRLNRRGQIRRKVRGEVDGGISPSEYLVVV